MLLNKKGYCLLVVILIIFVGYHIYERSFHKVDEFVKSEKTRQKQLEEVKYQVVSQSIDSREFEGWEVILGSSDTEDLVFFEGKYYLATSGGLKVYTNDFKEIRKITNLDGLAENEITSLAIFDSKLYIGLKSKGLMVFYKDTLTHYLFEDPNACKITAIFPTKNYLYIGTFGAGLIRFDGKNFSFCLNFLKGAKFKDITSLGLLNGSLVIGTQKNGLYLGKRDGFINLTKVNGLLSDRINSLNCFDNRLFVGTPRGLNEVNERLQVVSKREKQFVTGFALFNNKAYLGTFNHGIFVSGKSIGGRCKINSLKVINNSLFALTAEGIIALKEDKWEDVDSLRDMELSDNHITAFAFDLNRNLVVGSFERGLFILTSNGKVIQRIKSDRLQEINHLDFDSRYGILRVATSFGVAVFDDRLKLIQFIKEETGLIGENCAHIRHLKEKTIFSTNKGITIEEKGFLKSLYTLHGLINNHVYCSEAIDDLIYLGTLGGITLIKDNAVLKSYTTSNCHLSANWITAMVNVNKDLYVGTYGGGVDRLSKDGKWINFYPSIGKFEVNFNGFYYDKPLLFVGTLDKGVFIYNIEKDRWFNLKRGLSSLNVTAITADGEYIYFGTDCGITKMPKIEVQKWL
ncbi:hypothetical protein KKG61_02055 [bacterium]|nr:hypothetical protein [bacterium]MBU1598884.1 hypothetical protein [bacterium]MBU2461318.1 hypothetical protein [bacterium]